jgi:hypothetical protein
MASSLMPNTIGMSVPGESSLMPSLSDQVAGETEDERRKRLQSLQASRQLPGNSSIVGGGYGAALGG